MSPVFGAHSKAMLEGAHPELVRVFEEVIKHADCSILDSLRTIEQQRKNVAAGLSQTMDSKHLPDATGKSRAVDAAPYPQRWNENTPAKLTLWEVDQIYFAGLVMGIAAVLGVDLRYGGDWNSDQAQIGTGFRDLDHFELHVAP